MMNLRIGTAVVLAAGAACGFQAHAQVNEDAAKVLQDSAAAIQKISGISYKSQLYGVGPLKDIMDGEGEVKQIRAAGKVGRSAPVWIKGGVKELGRGKKPFTVSTWTAPEGDVVEWIDDETNTHFKRAASDRNEAQRILSLGTQIVMTELTEATPFAKQLKAQKVELRPQEQVRGVDCQVVVASWENGLRSEVWWIGVNDHLPRKIEMAHGQNRDLAKGTEIWDVAVLDNPAQAEMSLKTPAGYKEDFVVAVAPPPPPVKQPNPAQNAPVAPPPVVGIPPGSPAPEFELKANSGSSVKLSSLKGSVVVLTFGGSRFPKTETVNGLVKQVVDANKDKVQAFTLACREESEQAAMEYAKKASATVPVLVGADTVRNDYRVAGFPFTYVLTADGRVSKAFQGNVTKAQLDTAVAAALRGEVAAAPVAAAPPAPVARPALPNLSPNK